jgi:uncharacterized protein
LYYVMGEPFSGVIRRWHSNGQISGEDQYQDGVLDGPYRNWHSNGRIWVEGQFQDGVRDGPHREWLRAGTLTVERTYNMGSAIAPPQGASMVERRFEATTEGVVISTSAEEFEKRNDGLFYVMGEPFSGVFRVWYSNGQIEAERQFQDGVLDGPLRVWHSDGQIWHEWQIQDGILDGPYREWHSNGQIKVETQFQDGVFDGPCKEWLRDGTLTVARTYNMGSAITSAERPDGGACNSTLGQLSGG